MELAVQDFFYRGRLARELDHTTICVIPNVPNASTVTNFLHISLFNVIYKCISQIVSWRLKDFLDKLVSPNQLAFIPGRWKLIKL